MGKSTVFDRIKRELLSLVQSIPNGKVAELSNVSAALNVPPRHVAYIISQLTEDEQDMVGWHRVVPTGGRFPPQAKRSSRHAKQLTLLAAEGVSLDPAGKVMDFERLVAELTIENASTIWADEVE